MQLDLHLFSLETFLLLKVFSSTSLLKFGMCNWVSTSKRISCMDGWAEKQWSNWAIGQWLGHWILNPKVPGFKTAGWLQGSCCFFPFWYWLNEYQNSWGLSGKKKTFSSRWLYSLEALNSIHKKEVIKFFKNHPHHFCCCCQGRLGQILMRRLRRKRMPSRKRIDNMFLWEED